MVVQEYILKACFSFNYLVRCCSSTVNRTEGAAAAKREKEKQEENVRAPELYFYPQDQKGRGYFRSSTFFEDNHPLLSFNNLSERNL